MTPRRLIRALSALAAPALLVPILATPAEAAPKAPEVPTLAEVAKIYPHLDGGEAMVVREKVRSMGEDCDDEGEVIEGASARLAIYAPAYDVENPAPVEPTGDAPIVGVTAQRLPSVKVARQYLREMQVDTKKCAKAEGEPGKVTVKKIAVRLGQQSWGYQLTWKTRRTSETINGLFVRKGQHVVYTMAISMDGDEAPSVPKSLALTKLALKRVA